MNISRRLFDGIDSRCLLLGIAVVLSACSGGSSAPAGGGGPVNRAPTANAGVDQAVPEMTAVLLNGSGSDPDAGDTLSYAWTQTQGQTVALNNANLADADFVAPDVMAGVPEDLEFQLTVADSAGASTQDRVTITVQEPLAVVTISGKVQYEFVPPSVNCNGLNFGATITRPIRQATVQIVDDATGMVIDSMLSNDSGDYTFTVNASTMVFLRVRAELKLTGPNPSWDVEVRDNTANTATPLLQRPLYALDGSAFDSGTLDMNRDLTATTGWGGGGYTGVRAAAPFSVLDTIYSMMSVILDR